MWSRGIAPFGGALARLSTARHGYSVPSRLFSTECMPSGKSRPIKKVLGASALAILGSGLYYGYTEGKLPLVSSIPLEHIDETKFDSTDDVVVVLLGSKRRDQYPKTQVDRLKSILPKGVKVCYTVKEGSDTRNPPVMLYKGMRKQFYASIDLLDPSQFNAFKSEMASFFTPVSQDVASLRQHPQTPEYVTYNSFQDSVVRAATPRAPIVLQLYEQGCFLCFLMRPFINSVNRHLQEIKSPVRIKRLNIEANDFPKGCPVTRATPTFVLYDGHPQGTKWSEFKPRDFVKKLVEVAKLDSRSQAYLEGLTEDVSKRFMLFGRWAHWISQSQAIQELVLTKAPVKEEDVHSRVLSSLMALDMERVDDLETNLQCLADDIISAEQDCLAVVQIMANEILRAEKKQ